MLLDSSQPRPRLDVDLQSLAFLQNMSSLAPPSPSVSPAPGGNAGGRSPNFRASMGPTSARPVGGQGLPPASPRPGATNGGARPTSELLGSAGMFQTPEGVYQS